MSKFLVGRYAVIRIGAALFGAFGLVSLAAAQGQVSVYSLIYGYSYANTQTTVTDVASGNILDDVSGTSYYSSFYNDDRKYSALGNPPVSPVSTVILDPGLQAFRQRGDPVGVTSATWTASSETTYGVNKVAASITGAKAQPATFDVSDGTTRIQYSASPYRYSVAQSTWQDLFLVTPQNPADLGTPTTAQFTVSIDGNFTKDTGSFYYNITNFDGSQSFSLGSGDHGIGAAAGDLVTFGPVTSTFTFNLNFGQAYLVTATLTGQVFDEEGAVDLMHTARITDVTIPTNAGIVFLSGAGGSAYGAITGGQFGQFGSGGGGGGGPILTPIPEPGTWGMMLAGLVLIGTMVGRRRTGFASARVA